MELNTGKFQAATWEQLSGLAQIVAQQIGGDHAKAIRRLVRLNAHLDKTAMPIEVASVIQRGRSRAKTQSTVATQTTQKQRQSGSKAKGAGAKPWKEVNGRILAETRGEKEKPEGDNFGWQGVMEKIDGRKRPSQTVR